ncbi:spectrin beta chain, non-erythrocytic 1 isoform X2 [Antennarius striatus]|uniref:spectrin beta chain, non-erythrocytic 1 isoform X2 n=1 Tax=Antennarius striatus TaxID=241820 RepID=UPI0035B1B109
MSESIMRKVQPFTIGTRLSVPTVPKCQEFTQGYLQNQSLDNCALQHNLNSLYLSRAQVCAHGPCLVAPIIKQVSPVHHKQGDMAAEDHLNQNVASPFVMSRSIKKITISGSKDQSENNASVGPARLSVTGSTPENNNNNNNITSTSDPHLPRIVGVSCENKPNSHFKVLLRKDSCDESQPRQEQTRVKVIGEGSAQQISKPESQKTESLPHTLNDASVAAASQSDYFTQHNSLFSKEVLQAEAWIKSKLQDLKDDYNFHRCPVQDWEEASQTLQRDLKDFENTLIQLNQMGEVLICKLNPTSDLVKKQLSQLRDQWQTLKQMAANQTRILGGVKNLQEFNKKVDKLEAWIKEKEEEQSLVNVLEENVDKMQLTRRILDFKQDEQLYRNLHEEINHLALKLEKQGKTDGKNISSRRKHINKMWLRVQTRLKNCHENLQLALEVSSFYQQADNTLFAIKNVKKGIAESKEMESFEDREIRDIAGQVMMLDVSVSQLSNLHPALSAGITQKQSEVKDCWALLQKVFRTDRTTLSPTGSIFTREDAELLTLARAPQCNVRTETQQIMGKEVKEEQNRLKGSVSTVDCGIGRRSPSNQHEEQQPLTYASPPVRDGPACVNDVIVRRQWKEESRKTVAESKLTTAPRGHPQLHVQLQRFTVSADKTLSWLKDNVSVATQVCSIANFEGLEAAKRCQHGLEQEILTNRARIEVVKREGHGLVHARHPGSDKIEEFLGQLEVLWEELRRRHQRNAVFLQASEQLGFRVVKVLQTLGSLEAWLESVELSMKESAFTGDPQTMSVAERESCLLEKEVAERRTELNTLRQEVDHLHSHSHPHTGDLPTRMEEVERKYHRVQNALTQQNSELEDTRMLTEFLERVELEESQELSDGQFSLGQPLHGEISSAPTLLELQHSSTGEPLIESMGDPVEELREAVEMLNDTVRERGRSQSHNQAIQELLRKHARLALHVEECLCCCKELGLDILEKETDMAIQCELDHCGLEALQERQEHLETDYDVIREKVKEMEKQTSQLEELCPERVHILSAKIQTMLQGWIELRKSVTENKSRLQEFVQLQDFFRSYLAMISWTEDTRSCIFSDTALHPGKDGQKPLAAELDVQIEQKFEEFDELVARGRNILDKEHHLTQMVKERMEELRSMLGWILVHWRAQKQQWLHKKSRREPSQDNIYSEAIMNSGLTKSSSTESHHLPVITSDERKLKEAGDGQPLSLSLRQAEQQKEKHLEDGYEVMKSIGPAGSDVPSAESPKPSIVVLKEPSTPSLGSTINLILSFGNTGDSQGQVPDPAARTNGVVDETSEPVHRLTVPQSPACKSFWRRCQGLLENTLGSLKRKRKIYRQRGNEVSTYLHVKDNNLAVVPVYENITLPCQKSRSTASASPTFLPPPSTLTTSMVPVPQMANVTFHPSVGSGSSFIFSSLKRMGKKRKRKRDARRHTIQKIMGVEEQTKGSSRYACETITYDTNTWPLKEGRRRNTSPKSGDRAETIAYMKNSLLKDIETECSEEYSITPYAVSEGPATNSIRSHCRFLSLGSVLSFDLPKDMTLIPSIQDIITIAPPECKKGAVTDPDPLSHRHTVLSSFKHSRPNPVITSVSADISIPETQTKTVTVKDLPDLDKRFLPLPPFSQEEDEDQKVPCNELPKTQFCLHEDAEQEWDKMSSEVKTSAAEGNWTFHSSQHPIYVNQAQNRAEQKHKCPSVHTLIRDLNEHQYHKNTRPQGGHEDSPGLQCHNQASHVVVNLKSAVSVSLRQDSSSIKLCTDVPCSDNPQPMGVVGRLMSLKVEGLDCTNVREGLVTSSSQSVKATELETKPVHLDHQQFEEEEEELEDIWNRTTNYRQSICSDIMYQPSQEESELSDPPRRPCSKSPSTKTPAVLYRNLATASAPNLLVAEFILPSHIQSLLGYDKEQSPKGHHLPLEVENRRSWAAFSNRELPNKTSVSVNKTASDLVKLPDVGDNHRYIYQYREDDDDDDEEEAKVGEEMDEHTGCPKDQSEGICQLRHTPQSLDSMELQEGQVAPGGRCITLPSQSGKPELQMMEGMLERKHKLQLGGKKAASRSWNSYHTVLYRHTMCFYMDRKDTLRSSACGLPLNLMGAECLPAPEYTKKPNCFRLRLRDGSEYLFSASSCFMMKKWMIKIQGNTGQSDCTSSLSGAPAHQDFLISLMPSSCSDCHGLAKCCCSFQKDVTSTFPRHKPLGTTQSKEISVFTKGFSHTPQSHLSIDEPVSSSDGGFCDDDGEGRLNQTMTNRLSGAYRDNASPSPHPHVSSSQEELSNKHRSHSFTSATFQKIKPMLHTPGRRGLETSSNYSVTLVVGDPSSEGPPRSGTYNPPLLASSRWQQSPHQDEGLRSYASLPRRRNKSVFKKFFGKKDI